MARFAFIPPVGAVGRNVLVGGGAPGQSLQPARPGTRVYSAPGVYELVMPYGVPEVRIECWSGGGAGGGATTAPGTSQFGGGGGGGGGYAAATFGAGAFTNGGLMTITVEGEDAGHGVLNGAGNPGQLVQVSDELTDPATVYVVAGGGRGGEVATGQGGAGGGSAIDPSGTDTVHITGEHGNASISHTTGGTGGVSGGGLAVGSPGTGTATTTGGSAIGIGGGGGGSRRTAAGTGGNGGSAKVVISWPPA